MTDMGFITDEVCDMVCGLTELVKLMAVEKPNDEELADLVDDVVNTALSYLSEQEAKMGKKGAGAKIMDDRQEDYENGRLTDTEMRRRLEHIFGKQTIAEIDARIKADNEAYVRAHT